MLSILYVDDEPALLEICKIFLESGESMTVDTACSVREGMDLIRKRNYDAVVSDYEMPSMNGILFLKALRAAGITIPFIIFTGKGREEIVIEAFNSGADSYLQKGGNPKAQFAELSHKIKKAVGRRRADRALEQSNAALRATLEATADGILVIDRNNEVTTFNRKFLAMWKIPEDVSGKRDTGSIFRTMDSQVDSPLGISTDPLTLKNLAEEDRRVVISLNDGRVFRRYSHPQMIDGEVAGSVWSFRDITDRQSCELNVQAAGSETAATESERKAEHENPWTGEDLFETARMGNQPPALRVPDGINNNAGGEIPEKDGNPVPAVRQNPGKVQTAEKKVHDGEDKYRNVFRAENSPLLLTDLESLIIEDVNDAACEAYGYFRNELVGRSFLELCTEPERAAGDIRKKKPGVHSNFHRRKDGTIFPVDISTAFFSLDGRPVFINSVRDMTRTRKMEEMLKLTNIKLNLLLGITRHDVLNKLTVLMGYNQLLAEKIPDTEIRKMLENQMRITNAIRVQIEFTREYESLGAKGLRWQKVEEIISRVNDQFLKTIPVICDVPDLEVFADPMIEKVFYNLFDNAFRYGEGLTKIRISSTVNGDKLVICFEDDGIGISLDDKERIFMQGYGKNTGLGLFLSREILSITGMSIRESGE